MWPSTAQLQSFIGNGAGVLVQKPTDSSCELKYLMLDDENALNISLFFTTATFDLQKSEILIFILYVVIC